jgi:hypothetical protein
VQLRQSSKSVTELRVNQKAAEFSIYHALTRKAAFISVQPNIRRIHPIVLTRPVVRVVPPEALVLFTPELVRAALYPVIVQDYTPPLLTELFCVLLLPNEASRTVGKQLSIQEDHPETVLELALVAPDLPTTLRLAQHVLKAWLQQKGNNVGFDNNHSRHETKLLIREHGSRPP